MVRKLHRQFCHCSSNKLKQLIKTSKLWQDDDEIVKSVDEISSTCDICKKFKKAPLRPVVGLPLATELTILLLWISLQFRKGFGYSINLVDILTRIQWYV